MMKKKKKKEHKKKKSHKKKKKKKEKKSKKKKKDTGKKWKKKKKKSKKKKHDKGKKKKWNKSKGKKKTKKKKWKKDKGKKKKWDKKKKSVKKKKSDKGKKWKKKKAKKSHKKKKAKKSKKKKKEHKKKNRPKRRRRLQNSMWKLVGLDIDMDSSLLTSFVTILLILVVIYHLRTIARYLYVVYKTVGRDVTALFRLVATKVFLYQLRSRDATVAHVFRENADKFPDKVAMFYEDQTWTFRDLDHFSNMVANMFVDMGYRKGDEVALYMDGRPEYVGIWLGLSKVGVVTALINTNLRGDTLVHSVTTVQSRALIYGDELAAAVDEVVQPIRLRREMDFFSFGHLGRRFVSGTEMRPMRDILAHCSKDYPTARFQGSFTDKLFYIYTSGTTGLPKAAIIKHCRYFYFGTACNKLVGLGSKQIIYTSIPLYHLAGGAIGTCQCLVFGNTMAIRSKFSASRFWSDCIRYQATAAQYIGEICRYVLTQPDSPADRAHGVKVMFGNGMRPNIWREFKARFSIRRIAEFYGATEGNANVVNLTGKEGACGFVSQIVPRWFLNLIYPVGIIKVNEETGEPVRGPDGLCIPCGPGESGEFVGKIIDKDPTRSFDGYANKEASEKKVLRNVFKHGDAVFASGDLLTIDDLGYVYFKDRTGDTFRWKGENVSTTEVESVLCNAVNLSDVVVFGVQVAGCEGRAGMGVIEDPGRHVAMDTLYASLKRSLPPYAIPVIVRLVNKIETTGTFKLPKVALQKEGYDPQCIDDPLYFLDTKDNCYHKLTKSLYEDVMNGQIRF
ncbi:Long-chain fatty acid transport protein 4 [Halotydeus destructor]|nr:Long-chain fatty acid transport protein 4 [Halotydeus destructor]